MNHGFSAFGHYPFVARDYVPSEQAAPGEPVDQGEYTQVADEVEKPAPDIVAMFKYPISIDGAVALTNGLKAEYGQDLEIATDIPGSEGWMIVVRPQRKIAAA